MQEIEELLVEDVHAADVLLAVDVALREEPQEVELQEEELQEVLEEVVRRLLHADGAVVAIAEVAVLVVGVDEEQDPSMPYFLKFLVFSRQLLLFRLHVASLEKGFLFSVLSCSFCGRL